MSAKVTQRRAEIGHTLGRRLRDLRARAGLTQPELGERASMAAAEVSRIENGRRTPTLETAERLAHALGVSLEELIATPAPRGAELEIIEQITARLRGQPVDLLVRVAAVVDALIRAG